MFDWMGHMEKHDWVAFAGFVVLIVCVASYCFVIQPIGEARAFNKFKGESQAEATYWDALFANLRIMSE